jgi:23S rRNA (pseudouridine1915-N3)-methyltransferase
VRLAVVAVGRLKRGPERDLAERYRERLDAMARALGFAPAALTEFPESRARRAADRCVEEAGLILGAVEPDAVLVALDERGRSDLSSERLAETIRSWRDAGRRGLTLAIGGADGLDPSVRARADLLLSFGALTLPHGLVRVLAFEQLYRATTILAGHPYHRGEASAP